MIDPCLKPDWPVPARVRCAFTTRAGGVSGGAYASLNLGTHVGDEPGRVAENRARVRGFLPAEPLWLEQRHTNHCVDARDHEPGMAGDACVTRDPGVPLVVQVADCLPVLVAAGDGGMVGVAHAGWRGLANGVLGQLLQRFDGAECVAWIGPGIGACHYQVGQEVRRRFPGAEFPRLGKGYAMDLAAIARSQLNSLGVAAVYGGHWCTHCDDERFFSHRRDGDTGRMAGLIWLDTSAPTDSG